MAFKWFAYPLAVCLWLTAFPAMAGDCVVLLHGMGRSYRSMAPMAEHLKAAGYPVENIDYPSTRKQLDPIVAKYLQPAIQRCGSHGGAVHLVTHSLGGILVRLYLQKHRLPANSRVVMLSPPNQGSEVADFMKDFSIYRWVTGPAGQQLGTAADSLPNTLGPVPQPLQVGVITGDRSLNPIFSSMLPGDDDGKVSVERAKLAGMADFLVVPANHTFIMSHPQVLKQTVHFLKKGRFRHAQKEN